MGLRALFVYVYFASPFMKGVIYMLNLIEYIKKEVKKKYYHKLSKKCLVKARYHCEDDEEEWRHWLNLHCIYWDKYSKLL